MTQATEAVQFLYKHSDLTYSAVQAVIDKLTDNGFVICRERAIPTTTERLRNEDVRALVVGIARYLFDKWHWLDEDQVPSDISYSEISDVHMSLEKLEREKIK